MGSLLVLTEWMQSQPSRSASDTGLNRKEPMSKAGWGFLHPMGPSYSSCWADVVASPVILGISEDVGVRLNLIVVGVSTEPAP